MTLRVVIDRPDNATWLTPEEKAHLKETLAREAASRTETRHLSLWQTLGHLKVLLFAVVYTALAIGIYGIALWMPQIIKGMGLQDPLKIGLVMAVPYLIATICMVLWSRHSDKTGERVWHCAGPLAVPADRLDRGGDCGPQRRAAAHCGTAGLIVQRGCADSSASRLMRAFQ